MSMSTHVVGFKAPDEKWKKMKAVWDACVAAGTPIPQPVLNFFEDTPPDDAGVEIRLDDKNAKRYGVAAWSDEGEEGFTVDLKKLRDMCPDLTHIRFYNSY